MNNKYFAYAVVLTLAITVINWYSFLSTSSTRSGGRGSGWSSHSSGSSWGGGSGGGHK
ncbi:MAG TPA: hypothetical protein VGC21_09720 [Telluria sp.]|jgi:uncharacterized membrane protein YgcG